MAYRYNPIYPTQEQIDKTKLDNEKWDKTYKKGSNQTLCYKCGKRKVPGGDIIIGEEKYPLCTDCAMVSVPAKKRKCMDCGEEFSSLNDYRQCDDCKRKRKRTIFRKD